MPAHKLPLKVSEVRPILTVRSVNAIPRRDMLVALVSAPAIAGVFAVADQGPVMGSAAFDWNAIEAKPTAVASIRSFFLVCTATLEDLEVHDATVDPGKSPHWHPNEEMVIVTQGTLEVLETGEWTRVGLGSVIFSASNQLHGLRNVGPEQAVYHVIHWKTAATPAAVAP